MRRRPSEELLDTDAGTPTEVAASLADLRMINRWFGGIWTTRALVERVAARTSSRQLSLLEVAAGSGDLPHRVRHQLAGRNLNLSVTLLDRSPDRAGFLFARVRAETEIRRYNEAEHLCWVVEYDGGDDMKAWTWVRVEDGLVLRQEARQNGESLILLREGEKSRVTP